MLGTPFLSVKKIATKVIKNKSLGGKLLFLVFSLGELEELNSRLLKIIVILLQNMFTEGHESKVLTFYFPLPFSADSC